MPRANRHFLPGHVWHITHRCHQKALLLKFARDRRRYLAEKRGHSELLKFRVARQVEELIQDESRPPFG